MKSWLITRDARVHVGIVSKERVLAANAAFYDAFARRDVTAMTDLWAQSHPVSCAHPGWDLLSGRDEVIACWLAILGAEDAPKIACSRATAEVFDRVAYVLCLETLEEGVLIATNVFVLEEGVWKIAHHQAGAIAHPNRESTDDWSFDGPVN
jgi:hypothetical protein